jgi:hypothetical protein
VADEAVFAIMDQTADPLSTSTAAFTTADCVSYLSTINHDMGMTGGAERGGGGEGGGNRVDFRDTAAFLDRKTGADGRWPSSSSCRFPHQLAYHRLCGRQQGLRRRADQKHCDNRHLLYLPGSAQNAADREYPSVSCAPTAAALPARLRCLYRIIKATPIPRGHRLRRADTFVNLKFEKPPKGNYTWCSSGKSGDLYDGIEQPLRVTDSESKCSWSRISTFPTA